MRDLASPDMVVHANLCGNEQTVRMGLAIITRSGSERDCVDHRGTVAPLLRLKPGASK
jgi:hypothetical protein